MKKISTSIILAAGILSAVSCQKDPFDATLTAQEKELKAAVEQYVPGVIYDIYGNLADKSADLYSAISALNGSGSYTQADIDKVCSIFLDARKYWEQSEAFLFGAATVYGIDPHIDSWPLNKDFLAKSLSNKDVIAELGSQGAGAIDLLGASSLGFHGLEFIFFRDGKNRTVASLQGKETDSSFASYNVTGADEIVFAAAVAEDLRNYCFELQVAWDPSAPEDRKTLVEDELELNTVMDSGMTYGENLLGTGKPGSTYRNWPEAVSSILVAGCSNICNEVANTKIGTAHYVSSSEYDPDYIESPYSKKSYQDFKDNILSIQYSLYGEAGATSAKSASIASFLKKGKYDRYADLESALAAALQSLDECLASGVAFVDNPTAAVADNAIVKINALDELLNDAADWVAKL